MQIWIRIQICNVTASQPRPLTYPASVATMHLAGVTKSYGDRTLLDDVSLRVTTGQRLCLIGRNGVVEDTMVHGGRSRALTGACACVACVGVAPLSCGRSDNH